MKELIVNADDFGLSSGVNSAVVKAWQDGILTGASLMVGGRGFEEAVSMARENPGLQVGLHLTLVQGRSVLPAHSIPGLADYLGDFPLDPVRAGMRYFFRSSIRGELVREIEAQIIRFRETGIPLSHIDGHLNIHMHPTVFDILSELMPKHGIASFRLTREKLSEDPARGEKRKLGRKVDAFIFNRLAQRCAPVLASLGMFHAGQVKGLLNSGRMTEHYLLKLLDTLQDGVTEIYLHPGCLPDAEISALMPDYSHGEELQALTSAAVKEKLAQLGVQLRNYRGEVKNYA
jgi:hopanoid biosynthesis associated protein HpnK